MPCPSFCSCSRCTLPFKGTWKKITNCLHPTTPHASSKMGRNVTRGVVAGQLVADTSFTGLTVDGYFPDMVVKGSQALLSCFIVFKKGSTIIERSFHGLLMVIAAAIVGVEFFLYKAAQACPLASSAMLPVALCLAQFALIIAYKCLLLAGFAASELSKEPYNPITEPQALNAPVPNIAIEIPIEQEEKIANVDQDQTSFEEPFQPTQFPPISTQNSNDASSHDDLFNLDEPLKNRNKKQSSTKNTTPSPFWEGKMEASESSSVSSQANSAP